MTNFNCKLPLKLCPHSNHCLSWSIRDEIRIGSHTFDGLSNLVIEGKVDEIRRYAEVLYHKTHQEELLIKVLLNSMRKRAKTDKNTLQEMTREFIDWGFFYSANGQVNVNYKSPLEEI